jgi:hypothetical protein
MHDTRKTAIVLESGVHRQRSFILEKRKEKQNAFKVFFLNRTSQNRFCPNVTTHQCTI